MSNSVSLSSTTKNSFYLDSNCHDHITTKKKIEQKNKATAIAKNVLGNSYHDKPTTERKVSPVDDCIVCKCSKEYLEEKHPSFARVKKASECFEQIARVLHTFVALAPILLIIMSIFVLGPQVHSQTALLTILKFCGCFAACAGIPLAASGIFMGFSLALKSVSHNNDRLCVIADLTNLVLKHLANSEDDDIKNLLRNVKMTDENIIQLLRDFKDTNKAILDIIEQFKIISKQQLQLANLQSAKVKIERLKDTERKAIAQVEEAINKQNDELKESRDIAENKIQELLNLVVDNISNHLVNSNDEKEDKKEIKENMKQEVSFDKLKEPLKGVLKRSLKLELYGSELQSAVSALETSWK